MSSTKNMIKKEIASSCFFRTRVTPPYRKALLKITERCDLHCVHCFVASKETGKSMSLVDLKTIIIPRLVEAKVTRVTLTGGEPLLHPDLCEIVKLLVDEEMEVGICTNGYSLSREFIEEISKIGKTHFNVSLDGFKPESHDKFRGKEGALNKTKKGIKILSEYGLLQGILVTPNNFAQTSEYDELFKYAIEKGADYVLMNPLSSFGRGKETKEQFGASDEMMMEIQELTEHYETDIQPVYIRFPNETKSLSKCETVGNIIYVYTDGRVAVCPYLAFATDKPTKEYDKDAFIAGNILSESITEMLEKYDYSIFENMGNNAQCIGCVNTTTCGKGCPAAVVAQGLKIGEVDSEICPYSHG